MSMHDEKFKVIEILDSYSVLINYGLEDGAEEEEEVRVLSEGPEVIDPDTSESLGTLDAVKAVLTITTAYEKFSLCKQIVSTSRNLVLNPLSMYETTTKSERRLKVEEDSISNRKAPNDDVIKVGDKIEVL